MIISDWIWSECVGHSKVLSTWPWIFGQHLLVQTDDDVVSKGLHLIWCTITTGIIIHSTCSGQSWVCFFSNHSFQGLQWLYTWKFWPNNISANCHHSFTVISCISPSSILTLPLFKASPHLRLVPDSTLHESLISSYYHSSCIILLFTFILLRSFLSPPFRPSFRPSPVSLLIILVPVYLFIILYSLHVNIFCMWFFCALLHPLLSFPHCQGTSLNYLYITSQVSSQAWHCVLLVYLVMWLVIP